MHSFITKLHSTSFIYNTPIPPVITDRQTGRKMTDRQTDRQMTGRQRNTNRQPLPCYINCIYRWNLVRDFHIYKHSTENHEMRELFEYKNTFWNTCLLAGWKRQLLLRISTERLSLLKCRIYFLNNFFNQTVLLVKHIQAVQWFFLL